jgi:hypothetical protein
LYCQVLRKDNAPLQVAVPFAVIFWTLLPKVATEEDKVG